MADIKELGNNIRLSWGLAAYMIIGLVGATYALTTIYNNFLLMDEKQHDLDVKIEYVDGRHDRKLERVQNEFEDKIKILEDRIKELEKPSSD